MKHAYLIMAHHEFGILEKLLLMLDHPNNDIYLHIDKKVGSISFLNNIILKYSRLYIIDKRIDIRWGDFSQVELELLLYQTAYDNADYDYFHLLSGVDLPIKSQDYIQTFFERHKGIEFVGFSSDYSKPIERLRYYHFPVKFIRNTNFIIRNSAKICYKINLKIQVLLKINRIRNDLILRWGANWASLTKNAVAYLLSQKNFIFKMCRFSLCADEVYKQTLLWNSSFRKNIYDANDELAGCCCAIDWYRGTPYTWTDDDYAILQQSEKLFARKFSSENMNIVNILGCLDLKD